VQPASAVSRIARLLSKLPWAPSPGSSGPPFPGRGTVTTRRKKGVTDIELLDLIPLSG